MCESGRVNDDETNTILLCLVDFFNEFDSMECA